MTQILNLNHLAPDIQEEILFLLPADVGRDGINERALRTVVACSDWREQRRRWKLTARELARAFSY
jgi:hypothetical protein